MKSIKKILAALLTAVLIIACIPAAFAAADNGNLIIENTVVGKQYDLYRVLDLNYSTSGDGTSLYSYEINPDFSDFFKNVKGKDWYESDNAAYHQIKALTASELSALADELIDWALDNKVTPTVSVTANDTTTRAENIPHGYYLLNPLAASGTPQDGYTTMFSLDTLSGNENTIIMKAQYPTVKKTFADETTAAKALSAGDTVDYRLTTSVPNVIGYDKYFFVIRDEMDLSLDFLSIKSIHIGTVELKSESNDFDVYTTKISDDKTAVEIVFNDFLDRARLAGENTPIVVIYSAKINEKAVKAGEIKNEAYIMYSNDPKVHTKYFLEKRDPGDPDNPNYPKKNAPIKESVRSDVSVYTAALHLHKVDEKGNSLTDAAFTISGDNLNTVIVTNNSHLFVEDENGTYYKLANGEGYTSATPTDATAEDYESTTVKYIKKEGKTVIDKKANPDIAVEGYVGSDGIVTFSGLGEGIYTITETVTPKGYITMDPIKISITFDPDKKEFNVQKIDDGNIEEIHSIDGKNFNIDIVNVAGTKLPMTGAFGKTMLYICGAAILIGAIIFIYSYEKKKKRADKKVIVDI